MAILKEILLVHKPVIQIVPSYFAAEYTAVSTFFSDCTSSAHMYFWVGRLGCSIEMEGLFKIHLLWVSIPPACKMIWTTWSTLITSPSFIGTSSRETKVQWVGKPFHVAFLNHKEIQLISFKRIFQPLLYLCFHLGGDLTEAWFHVGNLDTERPVLSFRGDRTPVWIEVQ